MTPSSDSLPVLIGQSGPLNGERWVIRKSLTVGREGDCDIVIADRKISRRHARFTPSAEGVILEDLNSKNGTYHAGEIINGPVVLEDGDLIQIALAQNFTFLTSDATIPLDFENAIPDPRRRLKLDKPSRRVWVNGAEIVPPLSAAQFSLLELLYRSEELVPRETIVKRIWDKEQAYGVSDQALDALVRRLRDRLANHDKAHSYVVTVRGHGLRLDNPVTGN
ncbi:MAG: FHA domain-containing protein [Chloroflexi bacterium]|nr:FHA domain-containing protein [Chloroflexota bacterium]MQC25983.1 FHA domain-containing protein [Chloroflexota bacterium]